MFPQRHHMRPDVAITTLTVSTPSRLPFSIFVFSNFQFLFRFVISLFIPMTYVLLPLTSRTWGGGGGDRGAGDREKRGREVYGRREKRGREARFPRWREAGENGKNYATLRNIFQSKKCKGAGAKKYRAGTEIEGYGKAGGSNSPVPPPPPPQGLFI